MDLAKPEAQELAQRFTRGSLARWPSPALSAHGCEPGRVWSPSEAQGMEVGCRGLDSESLR